MGTKETLTAPASIVRPALVAVMVAVVASVGSLTPRSAAAQDRCRSVTGSELDRLRRSMERQRSLRDSVRDVLVDAEAYDSTGALLVWTDEEEMKMRMALVNLDPPAEAYYRIRGLLAGHFGDAPPTGRNATVDLDAPRITIRKDTVEVCPCSSPDNDRTLREYMGQAIRRHPDYREYSFDEEGELSMFVDWQGEVIHGVLADSTGDSWLDRVLEPLAREMEFEPASIDGTPRGVWVSRRLRFRSTAH